VAQAHTLDVLFHNMASNAQRQRGMKNTEAMMKLALRAQNQCRATIDTLPNVKNPRQAVAIVGQANIAGVQQVNNNVPAQELAPAEEIKKAPNELIEVPNEKTRLDKRTASAGAGEDPRMETVGAVHRPAHVRR
jgi:hypothetical protein